MYYSQKIFFYPKRLMSIFIMILGTIILLHSSKWYAELDPNMANFVYCGKTPVEDIHLTHVNRFFSFIGCQTIAFSLNVFTQFSKFSDKNVIAVKALPITGHM